jgi:hypothetical protein
MKCTLLVSFNKNKNNNNNTQTKTHCHCLFFSLFWFVELARLASPFEKLLIVTWIYSHYAKRDDTLWFLSHQREPGSRRSFLGSSYAVTVVSIHSRGRRNIYTGMDYWGCHTAKVQKSATDTSQTTKGKSASN